jgi:hypothetical protein
MNEISVETPSAEEKQEIHAILQYFRNAGGGREAIYNLVDSQLTVLHGRAQSRLQMAGVVITVTGFSGRIIADTNKSAQALIIGGVALVALASIFTLAFVMPIRWLSGYLYLNDDDFLLLALRRRKKKHQAFKIASAILVFGMAMYVAAIAIMLYYPEATELTKVR